MLAFDYVFLGFGPICHSLMLELLERNSRASVLISTDFYDRPILENHRQLSIKVVSKDELLRMKVNAEILFIATRKLTSNSRLESAIMNWLTGNSINFWRVLHLSSAKVYQGISPLYLEKDFDPVLGPIKNDKQNLERFTLLLSEKHQSRYSNLRISNVYGKSVHSGFIHAAIQSIIEKRTLSVFKEREYVRDYIHIRDVSNAISTLAELSILPQAINISTGIGTNLPQLIDIFVEDHGLKQSALVFDKAEATHSLDVIQQSVLSCALLQALISWNPTAIRSGIKETFSSQ